MSAWRLELDCPCGSVIPDVDQFEGEPICCLACRRVLKLNHECAEGGCYGWTETLDWLTWIGIAVWREQLAALVRTNGVQHPKYVDYPLIAAQLAAATSDGMYYWGDGFYCPAIVKPP